MKVFIRSVSLLFGAAAMITAAIPAQAQFRGMFNDARRGAQAAEGCEDDKSGDMARGIVGGLLGGAARRSANRAGLGSFVPVAEFSDQLTKEIACQLTEEEQKQAADATIEATTFADEEGNQTAPEVGRSAEWTSETRDDVSGSSTVTAREASSGDDDCITVTDVIIVEG